MVLEKKQTTIAYRCPHCGAGVIGVMNIFALSAPMIKLKCDCGNSEMTVVKQNDGKIRLTVPCLFCPKPHSFLVSANIFFGKEDFFLQCPYSDMDVCFLGDADNVKAHLAKGEYELIKLMEEHGINDISAFCNANKEDDEEALDSELTQSVLFVLSELEAEGKIFCECEHCGCRALPQWAWGAAGGSAETVQAMLSCLKNMLPDIILNSLPCRNWNWMAMWFLPAGSGG